MRRIGSLLMLVCALSLVIGCGGGGGGDGGDVGGIMPITNAGDASVAAEAVSAVIDTVLENLADGTYNNEVVYGISGTASVTGDCYHYSGDCGVDCVESWNDVDLMITFANYEAACADNAEATLSGTITYTDDTWSQQQGQNYNSGGSVDMAGSDVSFYMYIWYEDPIPDWCYEDTISFELGEEGYHGCCIPSNGVTYCF